MTDHAPNHTRYALLLLGAASYVCFTFAWFTLPAFLAPIVAEVGISRSAAGLVVGAVPLTYVPFALASGLLIDRLGPRRAIGAGLLLIGLGQVGRSGAEGFLALFVPTLLVGLGGTGITFGLPKLVAVLFESKRAGQASAVYMIGSFAGTAAAFGLGRPVIGPALGGWRPLFLWSGVIVAAASVLWLVATAGRGLDRRDRGSSTDTLDGIRRDLRTIVSHRGMQLLVVVGSASLLAVHGTMGWLTVLLEDRGFAAGVAAGMTTLLVVARVTGTIALPTISDVLGARRSILVGSAGLLVVGLAGLVVTGQSWWATVLVVVTAGLGFGGLLTLIRVLPIEYPTVGPDLTGSATGLIYSVGQVGGFLGPFLIGALYDATGTHTVGLLVLAAAGVVALVAGNAMPDPDG